MFRIIQIIILGGLVAFLVSWLAAQQGTTSLEWLGYRLEIQTSFMVAVIGLGCLMLIILDRGWRAVKLWPRLLGAGWVQRRRQQGEQALGLGLVALAAGDLRSARRQARKAERLMGRGMLPDLLAAQSAHALGDTGAALRYFTALAGKKETAYFGQLGLMQLHLNKQDKNAALASAQKALALQPDSRAAGHHMLQHHLASENWSDAQDVLQVLSTDTYLELTEKSHYIRQMACLSWLQAETATGIERETHLAAALRRQADFLPALLSKAAFDADEGYSKRSLKRLEKQFMAQPHPDFVGHIQRASGDNGGQLISRLSKLAETSEKADDAKLVVARAALDAGIWASASNLLSKVAPLAQTNAYFLMQAELAEIAEKPAEAAAAMVSAAHAPHGPAWRCSDCQIVTPQFEGICPSCQGLASIDWQPPLGRSMPERLEHQI